MSKSKSQIPNPNEVTKLQEEITTLTENWKRALADYQNLVKRNQTERQEFIKLATASLISQFIPSLDILDLAAEHSQDQGVKMAVNILHEALKNNGVEEIIPKVGDEFNPLYHECVENLQGEPDNTVAEMTTKGYKIGEDFVIRPAKVKVFKLALDN